MFSNPTLLRQANMDMWLCLRRAITAAERAKRAYDDSRAKIADAEKRAILAESRASEAERRAKEVEDSLAVAKVALESGETAVREAVGAKEAIQVVLEDSERAKAEEADAVARKVREEFERSRAGEIEAAVQKALAEYQETEAFSTLLDQEVGTEMADLVYRFKRLNPGQKLNLNFAGEFPPLPEGLTEDQIEAYQGEDAPPEEADAAFEVSEAAEARSPL